MIQEAKDIRKGIITTARENKAEKGGDRDGGGERQRNETTNRQAEVTQRGGGRCMSGQTPGERARGHPQRGRGLGSLGETLALGECSFLFRKERRKPGRNAQNTDHSHQPLSTKHVPRAAPGPEPGLGGASLRGPLPR